jgi:anti-anti-sigma factor
MSDTPAYLETSIEDGVLVLTVTRRQIEGEDSAAGLKEELLDAVNRHGLVKVVLDLKNTRYVSSIAFWPLLQLRKRLLEQDGRLILCGLTGAVHEVFTSTRMVSASGAVAAPFEVAPDRAVAITRLRTPAAPPLLGSNG